jgi:L-malate glycosyltransferase
MEVQDPVDTRAGKADFTHPRTAQWRGGTMMSNTVSPMAGKSVMFLINQDLGGGVEYLGRVLSSDLESRGAHCKTCYIYPEGSSTNASKAAHILRKATAIAKASPDVVITFQPTASAIAALAGRMGGCKVRIVHQSNSPAKSHPIMRRLDRILGSIGAYSVTIANSRATISEFSEYPSSYKKRIKLIEHGIPPPLHVLSPADVLAKFAVPENGAILLMAARLDLQKGQHLIVSALPSLPGVRLVMAGSGPERENLTAQARRLGVEDRIHFLGHVGRQDLTDLYRAATLMVFPSTWETFGLAAVEAAMVGLPVIASDIPALREVLMCQDHTTARYVSDRTPECWVAAISECLSDRELRPRSNAFAHIVQKQYSEDRMLQGYTALYAELVR